MHQLALNVAVYWLALLFISIVNNISAILPCTKPVTQAKGNIYRCLLPKMPS